MVTTTALLCIGIAAARQWRGEIIESQLSAQPAATW
jgi:hypothetical protein